MKEPFIRKLILCLACSGASCGYFGQPICADTQQSDTVPMATRAESPTPPIPSLLPDSAGVRLANQELPELVSVLERLKQRAPAQFDKAVKDLDRAAKRSTP